METMKRINPKGVGVSAIVAIGFLSLSSAGCLFDKSAQTNDSSSIAISRSQIVDPQTGSIIFVSSLKRN
jgi:hypothetical protein